MACANRGEAFKLSSRPILANRWRMHVRMIEKNLNSHPAVFVKTAYMFLTGNWNHKNEG